MDFYPGKAITGDLPPRKGFAEKWHPPLLAAMPKSGDNLAGRKLCPTILSS